MTTYTKIDDATVEAEDLVSTKRYINITQVKAEIGKLQAQLNALNLILSEAALIGVI